MTGLRGLVRSLSVLLPVLLCLALLPSAEAASFWSQTYGGIGSEKAFAIVKASDGGYAVAGTTSSFGAGGYDFWLLKIDADGNLQWNKTYGGTLNEVAFSLVAAPDGGYILAGVSNYPDDPWLENILYGPYSGVDAWVVKTDAQGNMLWNKTYRCDSCNFNLAYSIVATSDGGYAFCGTTYNLPYNTTYTSGFWLVKIDAQGSMLWNSTFSSGNDSWTAPQAYALVQADDGGYALAGNRQTSTEVKFWLIKTDSFGVMQWNKTYGNSDTFPLALTKTTDGGYAVAGVSIKYDSYEEDCMLVKTDGEGNIQWSHEYGGVENDWANAVIQTSDGGYALAGYSDYIFMPQDLLDWHPMRIDAYLVKTDASGNMQWSKTYGGGYYETSYAYFDGAYGVVQAQDGGYVLAGYTSYNSTTLYGPNDLWLLKTDELGVVPESVPTTNITAKPTQQPSSTPTSTAPSPSPPIPELSLLVIMPLMLSLLSMALILRHKKQFKKP